MNPPKKNFPYLFYYSQVVCLNLLGLATSLYLGYTHYKNYTDLTFSSFCAITEAINCDTVAQSPWSVFLGMPVALWGIFAYSLFTLLLIPLKRHDDNAPHCWALLTILALVASCFSVYLAVISAFRIHSWCILCLISYAVNFLLSFSSWIVFRRFSTVQIRPSSLLTACKALTSAAPVRFGIPLLIGLLVATQLLLPAYWIQEADVTNPKVTTGVTKEGSPWIGAENPQFTIEEFTDYQCFQCRKMHFYLRQLINRFPERIRLVHRHYPLDHEFNKAIAPNPFHIGSGKLALIAIVASERGMFWVVNDALYKAVQLKDEKIQLNEFAELMKLDVERLAFDMYSAKTLGHLRHDILNGLQHKLTGTPSFTVNGEVYQKLLPPHLLQEIIK
ncbi:vitamin K epoxide reductase family protein [uncultured Desulfobulbus sp.]|uniref:vitamin K epoxide reductase/DsbA family protein n=1 Tax=uncultured Desulfobulbus sp. TaxID=239745 RepID=UPI0029C6B9A0|nr:vitamin K epoxide reductase family protein [uncultured Desulfobulbus sp.]